jgi:nucleoside 2-deoxyribosyltransferase
MDIDAIRACDVLLAVLDGPSVDDGVSFELGYATCLGKTCVGLATDSRRAVGYFRNPMWDCALQRVFYSMPELLEWAAASGATSELLR